MIRTVATIAALAFVSVQADNSQIIQQQREAMIAKLNAPPYNLGDKIAEIKQSEEYKAAARTRLPDNKRSKRQISPGTVPRGPGNAGYLWPQDWDTNLGVSDCYPYVEGFGSTELNQTGFVEYLNFMLWGELYNTDPEIAAVQGYLNMTKAVDIEAVAYCDIEHYAYSVLRAVDLVPKDEFNFLPAVGKAAQMCTNSQRQKHGVALWDSLAVGSYGSVDTDAYVENTYKDCFAWCVFDIRNPNHHFRWRKDKQCYEFKRFRSCVGSDLAERDYGKFVAENTCEDPEFANLIQNMFMQGLFEEP